MNFTIKYQILILIEYRSNYFLKTRTRIESLVSKWILFFLTGIVASFGMGKFLIKRKFKKFSNLQISKDK